MTASRCLHFATLALALALASAAPADAAPVPGDLSIQASIALDVGNSLAALRGGTQSATLTRVAAGAATASSFTDKPTTLSPAALGGALSATGDGVGALFSMSGSLPGASTDALFADYSFLLANASATETFTVTFRASIANDVSASGDDAFAFSQISVKDDSLAELVFSDHAVDTLNPGNNFTLGSANDSFLLTLAPGASLGFTALQSQRGGVFSSPGDYAARLDAFIFIEDITSTGGVPLSAPATPLLVLLALGALGLARRRSSA